MSSSNKKIEIGGYFELEIPGSAKNLEPLLKNGRSALLYIIQQLKIKHLNIPYLICDVIPDTLEQHKITYDYYHLDEMLEISDALIKDQHYLYVNYFGLKREYTAYLSRLLKDHVIIDNTHDLTCDAAHHVASWAFNSLRKFVGTPDGAVIYTPNGENISLSGLPRNKAYSIDHLIGRLEHGASHSYSDFQANEEKTSTGIERSTTLSEQIYARIDLKSIAQQRRKNFQFLRRHLDTINKFPTELIDIEDTEVPFSYPLLPKSDLNHRYLWDHQIFAPKLWKNCTARPSFEQETFYAENVIHLPIDHRYGMQEMMLISNLINSYGQ